MARSPRNQPVDPATLDLGHLALFVGFAFADAVQGEIARAGFDELRFSHGFVFQHLLGRARSSAELAALLEVTQQAVSKSVAELEEAGYVERVPDPEDARLRRVRLTERGRAAVKTARRARRALERRLSRPFDPRQVENTRALLTAWLEELGGAAAVRGRRVIAPR